MTENDYIAEYVKENHQSLLGLNFAIWKFKRQIIDVAQELGNTLGKISKADFEKIQNETELEENERDRTQDKRQDC